MLKAIATQVLPAYARFGRFLSAQYIPHGRTEPGIWSLPDGDAYYKFLVRQSTTTDLTPDQIHKIGEQQVAEDEAQMTAIAKKLGFADLKALRASIPGNPKLHPTSPEALIAVYRGYLDGMKPKLPQLFGRLPKAPLEIQPVPAYMAKDQAAAYYQHGTPDGKRPGHLLREHLQLCAALTDDGGGGGVSRGAAGASSADLHRAGADRRAGVPEA